jgi:RHS repeat-associated protein
MLQFLFLFFCCFLYSTEYSSVIHSENEPSALVVGKVNAITGKWSIAKKDLVIQGVEPIIIQRTFLERERCWEIAPSLYIEEVISRKREHSYLLLESTGAEIRYKFTDEKLMIENERYKKYVPVGLERGYTNTSRGAISSRTNLQNNILFIGHKEKHFIFHCADGTVRTYHKVHHGRGRYELLSEHLPNGNWILYEYEIIGKDKSKTTRLKKILSTNPNKDQIYASAEFIYEDKKGKKKSFKIRGSDGKSAEYKYVKDILSCVKSSDHPDTFFDYHTFSGRLQQSFPTLKEIRLPMDRRMQANFYTHKTNYVNGHSVTMQNIEYQETYNGEIYEKYIPDPRCKRIMTLSAPVGNDATLRVTHSFLYDLNNKRTSVFDSKNQRVDYYWDGSYRLISMEWFDQEGQFQKSEQFSWSQYGLLLCKRFYDANKVVIWAKKYAYNSRGDIREERIYGNLSGRGPPLLIGADGFPLDNGVESYAHRYTYITGSRANISLLQSIEEDNGTKIEKTYLSQTDRIKSQITSQHGEVKEEKYWEYDANNLLIKEITQTKATHLVRQITPKPTAPYLGLPWIIEEKYVENGMEHLIRKTVLHYGDGGRIEKKEIYDAANQARYTLKLQYDEKGHLISETNPEGQQAIYTYDPLGNQISAESFSKKLKTLYSYDFSNRLIKKEEKGSDGNERSCLYGYDTNHHLISETDPYLNKTTYVPNYLGLSKEIHLPSVPNEKGELIPSITHFKYDSAGNEIEKKDAAGNVTQVKYNACGKPIHITHPDQSTEEFTYYLDGNLKAYTDPKGIITSYKYDYLGQPIYKKTGDAEEVFVYIGSHLKKRVDAENNETIYEYDSAGRKMSEQCAQEESFYTYDEFGRLHSTQKGDLLLFTEYDLLGQVIEERSESIAKEVLRKIRYQYDADGNREAITRFIQGKEEKETFKYDSFNRLTEQKDALNFVQTYAYDSKSNKKTHTDALGLETIEICNAQNKIASIEKRKRGTTLSLQRNYYEPTGKLTLQIDTICTPTQEQKQIRTCWQYNSRGLLKTLMQAENTLDMKITHYTYTPRGELETLTKPNGIVLNYRYNDLGHLESLSSSDGTIDDKMEYNRLGHLQKSGKLSRKTDPFGRILSETFPQGHSIQNTYDKQGRKATCTLPEADCLITYDYSPTDLKQIHRKKLDQTLLYSHTYLSYDLSGNLLEQTLINSANVLYLIDPLSRTTSIQSELFSQQILSFDPVGNILQASIQADEILYTYDDLYQLTSESGPLSHSYQYDSLYNRLQKDEEKYQINPLNQLTSHLSYNANGNPIQQNDTIYTYDALDRLIKIESPTQTQTFTYDCMHRCLSKTTDQKTQYFLYDNQNEIGSFDSSLTPLELRILDPTSRAETGAAIAIEMQDQIYAPIHDLQGNIAVLIPTKASFFSWFDEPPTYYRYNAFGEEKIIGTAQNPWRFASKRTDSETKLIFFGRRYYDPTLGRWLTQDPIQSHPNLYLFLNNNPLIHLDFFGLYTSDNASNVHYFDVHDPRPNNFSLGTLGDRDKGTVHYHCGINNTQHDSREAQTALYKILQEQCAVESHWIHNEGMIRGLSLVAAEKLRKHHLSIPILAVIGHSYLSSSYIPDVIEYERLLLSTNADKIIALNDPSVKQVHVTFSNASYPMRESLLTLSPEQRDTVILISTGPTTLIERHLAHKVYNIIGDKDWPSRICSGSFIPRKSIDVDIIPQTETKPGILGHYATQPEYQDFIKDVIKKEIKGIYEMY